MLRSFLIILVLTNLIAHSYGAENEMKMKMKNGVVAANAPNAPNEKSHRDECLTNSLEKLLLCRGSRAIRNAIHNLNKSEKPIVIIRGLEIVRSRDAATAAINATENANANVVTGNHRKVNDVDVDVEDSLLGRFSEYLRTHELNIKFSDLLEEESERYAARDLERNNGVPTDTTSDSLNEARKKDKGQGIIMAMALMFGKMLALLGLGGIGAVAMKALGVAVAALTLAGIVGLKSLSQQGGGHESSHSVQYLTPESHHHKRRRRRQTSNDVKQQAEQLYDKNQTAEVNQDPMEMAYRDWMHERSANVRNRGGDALEKYEN